MHYGHFNQWPLVTHKPLVTLYTLLIDFFTTIANFMKKNPFREAGSFSACETKPLFFYRDRKFAVVFTRDSRISIYSLAFS
jgi:hypothetical protein